MLEPCPELGPDLVPVEIAALAEEFLRTPLEQRLPKKTPDLSVVPLSSDLLPSIDSLPSEFKPQTFLERFRMIGDETKMKAAVIASAATGAVLTILSTLGVESPSLVLFDRVEIYNPASYLLLVSAGYIAIKSSSLFREDWQFKFACDDYNERQRQEYLRYHPEAADKYPEGTVPSLWTERLAERFFRRIFYHNKPETSNDGILKDPEPTWTEKFSNIFRSGIPQGDLSDLSKAFPH